MKISRSVTAMAAVFATAVVTGGWFLQKQVGQEQSVYFQARLFQEVVDRIASDYVEPLPKDSIYRSAIDATIEALGDPNTSLMEPDDYEDLRIRTSGDYGGVGLEIDERDGFVTVIAPIPGSPGARAGILPGDQFWEIEGKSAAGWEDTDAVDVLRGKVGTEVHVKMKRPGVDEPIPFTLVREQIHLKSVPFALGLPGGIAYIPLQVVRETSSDEVRASLDSLKAAGTVKGLVLDLRGNPGGLLEQGIAVSDLFVPQGVGIAETRGRTDQSTVKFSASRGDRYAGLPVVVMVDEYSASASEIISGALQDHDRALVVGNLSYGKGSVQTLFKLSGGNVLRLTTARWFTPLGRSIDKPHDLQIQARETGTRTLDGRMTTPPDLTGRPVFKSTGGRTLFGGGGITPDVIVLADTLTTEEQNAMATLFKNAGSVRTSLFDFAVGVIRDRPGIQADFQISDQDVSRLYDIMSDTVRAEIDREMFMKASRFLRYDLEVNVALQKWGEGAEFQRRIPYDLQIQKALELLGRADSPASLFRVAEEAKSGL